MRARPPAARVSILYLQCPVQNFLRSSTTYCKKSRPMLQSVCYRPYTGKERGDYMDVLVTFLITVAAGVACHCICKWLDSDK